MFADRIVSVIVLESLYEQHATDVKYRREIMMAENHLLK